MQDRRHFTRIIFSTPVHLSDMGKVWSTELIDLSLKGALVKKPKEWKDNEIKSLLLTFTLAQSDIELTMNTSVVHEKEQYLGLLCEQIDIDSATHLKRLIELNVGDDALLNRELDALAHPE
ncbi:PilZ domain-containing protein [Pseudoalteromonas denitrificans]|uniref:Cyclic diguanosine monophosphate-binding protein n=1 Tax=Pseudoalteromonas denitrificans DSM 6059 TaxID=1123010 RepID=A0A1I1EIN8_9GAMM|nr:PilZ domain-containing protein [Pseudoalteromonas denitrificans]SFB86907.1 PilZ domain-containing protein [Pseudoalteromonas denitrificans DSM 6059]